MSEIFGITLTLEASEKSTSAAWNQAWYLRCGFTYHERGSDDYGPSMIRATSPTQRKKEKENANSTRRR
jgi:hypothetical protein